MPSSLKLAVVFALVGALSLTSTSLPSFAFSTTAFTPLPSTVAAQTQGQEHRVLPCTEQGNDDSRRDEGRGRDDEGCARAGSSSGIARGDFNGDTIADLAVGVPGEDVGGIQNAGAVHVIYGASTSLSATNGPGDQFFPKNFNPLGNVRAGDGLGTAIAAGDFNDDGKSDLAVATPGGEVNGSLRAGYVEILYGDQAGLTRGPVANQLFSQSTLELAESDDRFGQSMSWGDFNGDGVSDLVIGVPFEDVGTRGSAGAVHILYGSPTGLTTTGHQFLTQDSVLNGVDVRDAAEAGDNFGKSITAGDFNADGKSDLAVGVPNEDLEFRTNSLVDVGAVNILFGTGSGLTSIFNQLWTQNSVDNNVAVLDAAENFDRFGSSLAAGDFNGDSRGDLAIGVPFEDQTYSDVGTLANAGGVHVLYSSTSAGALSAVGNQFLRLRSSTDVSGTITFTTSFDSGRGSGAGAGDLFGSSLAAGDFNRDGRSDLAIGEPGSGNGTGSVNVAYGGADGIVRRGELIIQGLGVFDEEEEGDEFGTFLTAWDFNADGFTDLAIGVPGEDLGTLADAGAVNVLYGRTDSQGLRDDNGNVFGDQFWTQDSSGVDDFAEAGDGFGSALY